jgi:hypothetical protein
LPLLGMSRHIVVTDSDTEVYEEARAAYEQWFANLNLVWRQRGVPIPLNFPSDFDDAVNAGFCVVGSPSTVRDRLLPQVEEAGIYYLLGRLAFGNLALERSLRSVELLEEECSPPWPAWGRCETVRALWRMPATCKRADTDRNRLALRLRGRLPDLARFRRHTVAIAARCAWSSSSGVAELCAPTGSGRPRTTATRAERFPGARSGALLAWLPQQAGHTAAVEPASGTISESAFVVRLG